MKKANVVAIARAVLFRRMRTVLIRPYDRGLIATTLNFDYEVRSAKAAFQDIPKLKIEGEMLDLARHIINTKRGEFDPATFDDRYEAAVAELVKAKIEGKALPKKKAVKVSNANDLLAALRKSAGMLKDATMPERTAANVNAGSGRGKARRAVPIQKDARSAAQRKAG